MVFGIIPEHRSASLRNERSASAESPWWSIHGAYLSVDEFLAKVPDTLHQWFYEMFAYAHGSEAAKKTARTILSVNGSFFQKGLLLTALGANFFLNLTEADTDAALEFLEATLAKLTREQLLDLHDGRQRIVWALEKIAVERHLFVRAARLLLKLAEAENTPGITNNATGTFANLFSLGPGRTAPTQTPPPERFPVLKAALDSNSEQIRSVALKACDRALETQTFTRMYGAERRGLRDLDLWMPKTYDEWHDAYGEVWNMLRQRVGRFSQDEQSEAAQILLKHAFGLLQIERLESTVADTVSELTKLPKVSRKDLLESILYIIDHSDHLPPTVKQRFRDIEKEAVGGDDFKARLKRQVTLPVWRLAPQTGLSSEPWQALAEEAVEKPQQLLPVLPWLMTAEAESAVAFGFELGKADRQYSFYESILHAIERTGPSGNLNLLGGYLRAMHEADEQRWLSTISDLSQKATSKRLFPGIVMQSGLSNDAGMILIRLVEAGDFSAHQLEGFIYGGEVRKLSAPVFGSWIAHLVKEKTQRSSAAALRLVHFFVLDDKTDGKLPAALVDSVLLNDALFEKNGRYAPGSLLDFDWSEVARKFLHNHPDRKLSFARKILENMGRDSIVLPRFGHSYGHQILSEIAEEFPREVWAITAPLLGPPDATKIYAKVNVQALREVALGDGEEVL